MEICYSCLSNSGEKRISPGKQIHKGLYWTIEHAFPSNLVGWIVIVLNRHCEILHDITEDEWLELARLQYILLQYYKIQENIEKEYIACFAEMEGFKHIHFHIIPKTNFFLEENKGTKAFQYLKVEIITDSTKNRIIEECISLHEYFSKIV